MDGRGSAAEHHKKVVSVAGRLEVIRPTRLASWWQRHKVERACRRAVGHCWHPDNVIDWWCCCCSAETEGMPDQCCIFCVPEYQLEGVEPC
jgi:hypothetical protein